MASETLVPLESNPDVLNKFLQMLGVPSSWSLVDVMGLDPDMLAFVPRPVLSVLLLFPTSDVYEQYRKKQEGEILAKGQEVSENVFYMKQNLSNACGTIALVHGVANNTDRIKLSDGHMKEFLEEAKKMDSVARGALLEKYPGIINAHKELAQEGQTNTPRADDVVIHHFISLIHKDGSLYELDGRKAFPINHGPTTEDSLLEDAAKVCQDFMARDPSELRFTVMALTASD
ncbi:Ubiquitin carboxyl-terminal hydrolase [Operophtera brumata]|uniref:Ubiquitin carboxyl-terminal hydrolase n=1 Tax=Operophtera brumata TaxID=104452 RepID=A0A0L7KLJ4_OPEBR|nr:Ubiquitin carboxyl-terminal hydrolase [Operophtera brumata]